MSILHLFHTGFQVIEKPDITIGRRNADFGQGFYLSENEEFSRRWARQRKGLTTYLNTYKLDTSRLNIKRLTGDEEWFGYICANRANKPDAFADYDVVIGPIANDTIYDTWGIITSGLLKEDQALRLLMTGPVYEQTAIKTEKAASLLQFTGAVKVNREEIAIYRETVRKEEQLFQDALVKLLGDIKELTDESPEQMNNDS